MRIYKFVENNKIWLSCFRKASNTSTGRIWWSFGKSYLERVGLGISIDDELIVLTHCKTEDTADIKLYINLNSKEITGDILNYFKDWKSPTQDESDYFEMIEGYRLPWNEEHPFILPEYINE